MAPTQAQRAQQAEFARAFQHAHEHRVDDAEHDQDQDQQQEDVAASGVDEEELHQLRHHLAPVQRHHGVAVQAGLELLCPDGEGVRVVQEDGEAGHRGQTGVSAFALQEQACQTNVGQHQKVVQLVDPGIEDATHPAQLGLRVTALRARHQHHLGSDPGLELARHAVANDDAALVAHLKPAAIDQLGLQHLHARITLAGQTFQAGAHRVGGCAREHLQRNARLHAAGHAQRLDLTRQRLAIGQVAVVGGVFEVAARLHRDVAFAQLDGVADHVVVAAVGEADHHHRQAKAEGDADQGDYGAATVPPEVAPGQHQHGGKGQAGFARRGGVHAAGAHRMDSAGLTRITRQDGNSAAIMVMAITSRAA